MQYQGVRKIERFLEGSNHHLIVFDVDVDEPDDRAWVLIKHPMIYPATASIWRGYPEGYKWVGYNWADFVPTWTINPADFVIELRR
jgi:hypothetical protein